MQHEFLQMEILIHKSIEFSEGGNGHMLLKLKNKKNLTKVIS